MKKKIIALSLITSMIICNSMTVLADDITTWSGGNNYTNDNNRNVTATFGLDSITDTYEVEISWGSLVFNPTGTLSASWAPPQGEEDGYFNVVGHTGWESAGDTIIVTNKSNVDVKATFTTSTANSNCAQYYFIKPTIGIIDNDLVVPSPITASDGNPNNKSTRVQINSGTITKAVDTETHYITMGTVTVSLAKNE